MHCWLPAGHQLQNLTSLTVCAASICITVPATLRLSRLCLSAASKLCLHFDSVEEAAKHLRAFDAACRHLLHQEPIQALQVGFMLGALLFTASMSLSFVPA